MSLTELSFSQICESSPTDQDTLAAVNVRNVWNTVLPSTTWVTYLLPAPLKRKSKEIENSTLKWLAKSLNSASAVWHASVPSVNSDPFPKWLTTYLEIEFFFEHGLNTQDNRTLLFYHVHWLSWDLNRLEKKVRYTTKIITLVILEYFVCWGGKTSFRHKQ